MAYPIIEFVKTRALVEIERFKDGVHPNEQETRRFPNPINNFPNEFLNEVYRRTLSKGVCNESFPRTFMSILIKSLSFGLDGPIDEQRAADSIATHLA
jgi:hypothetical protein